MLVCLHNVKQFVNAPSALPIVSGGFLVWFTSNVNVNLLNDRKVLFSWCRFGNVEGPTFGALAAQGSPSPLQQQQQPSLGFGAGFGTPTGFGG